MKKRITLSVVIIIVILSSLVTNNKLERVRIIDIAQLITLGLLLGILFVNIKVLVRNHF